MGEIIVGVTEFAFIGTITGIVGSWGFDVASYWFNNRNLPKAEEDGM